MGWARAMPEEHGNRGQIEQINVRFHARGPQWRRGAAARPPLADASLDAVPVSDVPKLAVPDVQLDATQRGGVR